MSNKKPNVLQYFGSDAVYEYINDYAVDMNEIPFSYRDLIQLTISMTPFCYDVFSGMNLSNTNAILITISTDDGVISAAPGRCADTYSDLHDKNAVFLDENSNIRTFFLSSGFIYDNFKLLTPSSETLVDQTQTGDFKIFIDDIEEIIGKKFKKNSGIVTASAELAKLAELKLNADDAEDDDNDEED